MTAKAHPDDILIAGTMQEARYYRDAFDGTQIFTSSVPARLAGRKFRVAWVTNMASLVEGWIEVRERLEIERRLTGSAWHSVDLWRPEDLTLVEKIARMPRQHGPTSDTREFWRAGYSQAVEDVLQLIALEGLSDD